MKNVLIISRTENSILQLEELLTKVGYTSSFAASDSDKAKNFIQKHDFNLIVINTPLADGAGLDLAVYMIDHTKAGVLLLTTDEVLEKVGFRLEEKGVFTLSRPVNLALLKQTVKVWQTTKNRIEGLEKENQKLKMQVEEIKLIHRAKLVLMQCLSMSEPQAHRYLEKQAMDLRQSKKKIAEQVLNTYEV